MTKASGPDLISPRLLKEGVNILALPYPISFNRSLNKGYFQNWKEANVTPIYKKNDKLQTNQSAKIMEHCVHKYLYNYIISNHILTPLQSDFRHNDGRDVKL